MNEGNIFILSAPVGTGKTTQLLEWSLKLKNVTGVLTPVINNERIFFDLKKQVAFKMEAANDDIDVYTIGKFIFNKSAFMRAENIIDEAIVDPKTQWIIIDEIGPLELQGKGFYNILKKIMNLGQINFNVVLVIRDSILKETLNKFGIKSYQLLTL